MRWSHGSKRISGLLQVGFIAAGLAAMLLSCQNDIETINALTNQVDLPDVSGFNIEITYTDSGILKGKIIAAEAHDFNRKEDPYTEFPKGIHVYFYNAEGKEESYIRADYAIYHKKEQLWEGRGHVLAENPGEGKKLETEQIFWDQKNKRIYSEKYSTITTRSGVSNGENGFEAEENLTSYRMKGYKGRINVSEDASEEE